MKPDGRTTSGADTRTLARGVLTNFTGIGLRTSRVAFLWIIAKLYGTPDYAVYTLSFAVYDVLLFLCLAGFDNALWNFVPRYRGTNADQERSCLQTAVWLPVLASLILGMALLAFAEPAASLLFRKPEVAPGLRWMGAILPPATLARILFAATRSLKIMKYYVMGIELTEPLVMVAFALLFLKLDVGLAASSGPFAAHLVAEGVIVAIALRTTRKHFPLGSFLSMGRHWFHRETFSYAMALGGVNMSTLLSRRVDIFLVGRYLPLPQVAAYNLATEVAFIMVKLRAAFPPIVSPLMAEASAQGDHVRLRAAARRAGLWGTIGSIPLLALSLVFGPSLFAAFGMEARWGYLPLVILTFGHFLYTAGGPAGEVLAATGRPYLYTVFNSIPMVLTLSLGPLLIPNGLGVAAAILTGAGTAASKVPLALFAWMKLRIHAFSRAQAEAIILGALLGGCTFALAAGLPGSGGVEIGGLALAFCALFGGWIWRRKLLNPE